MNRVAARRKRQANPYIEKVIEVYEKPAKAESAPLRPPWRLQCGVMWPVHYMPEEPHKDYDTYFRQEVENLAALHGWHSHHVHVSDYDKPGLPDLYLIPEKRSLLEAGKRPMWRELKVRDKNGKPNGLTRHQKAFIAAVTLAGHDADSYLYPDDWFSGRIDKELGL